MDNEKEINENEKEDIFEEGESGLEEKQEISGKALPERGIPLPLGLALNDEELYRLSSREKIDFICILGPVGSGKTTFEAMLYSSFLRKVNDDLVFSGSQTIVGFEELLDYVRVTSGKPDVDMPRTRKENRGQFYHLELLFCSTNEKRNIVFADVAGELFDLCKAHKENLDMYMPHLHIAKNTAIFMDGEDFINNASWNVAIMNTKSMLWTIKSSKQYEPGMNIDIIISKNDKIVETDSGKRRIGNIEKQFECFEKDFNIKFFRIQALNDYKQKDDTSTSLIDMAAYWLTEKAHSQIQTNKRDEELQVRSYFNKFMERQSYE